MNAFYTIVFLPLAIWLVLIVVGVVLRLVINRTAASVILVLCLSSVLFPGLILLAVVALVCFGLSMLLRHLSGIR